MSDNNSAVKTKELTPEELDKVKTNFTKLMIPFRIDVTHKDDDDNEGETFFEIKSPTVLGALTCLGKFSTFQENGWKAVIVQELFSKEERNLVNSAELDRRITARLAEESAETYREGKLTFNYAYSHPFIKGEQQETLTIAYKYNQILHLIQMVNTVLTDKFSEGIIEGIMKDLDSEEKSNNYKIKL